MTRRLTMADKVERYLAHRRDLGYHRGPVRSYLRQFAAYADRVGHRGPVTTALVAAWARLPAGRGPACWARRLSAARGLARHLAATEPGTEIPPARLFGPATPRPTPHVYTDAEVAALMAAAGRSRPAGRFAPRSYAALVGLLACTGLRVSEALRLRRSDFDPARGLLTVRETKFHKSRLVPLHPSAAAALAAYARDRDGRVPGTADALLVTDRGGPLRYEVVRRAFHRWCAAAGVAARPAGRRPRIHDLRHTFACRRVERWYDAGADVGREVGALAVYLGHVGVTGTYWYLTGTPELLARAAARFEASAGPGRKEGRP